MFQNLDTVIGETLGVGMGVLLTVAPVMDNATVKSHFPEHHNNKNKSMNAL